MQLILTIAILSINYIKGILIDFLLLYAGTVVFYGSWWWALWFNISQVVRRKGYPIQIYTL